MESPKNNKQNIDTDELIRYIDNQIKGDYSLNGETPFNYALLGETFARLSVETLIKCPVFPESAALIAKFLLMQYKKPVLALMLIKKNMMIKDIVIIARGYRPFVSEFIPEIISECTKKKVKKCIVLYNFEYKKSGLADIFDLSKVHDALNKADISLIDAVCLHNGTATNIVHSINPDTYK